jgi:hypothetical protein
MGYCGNTGQPEHCDSWHELMDINHAAANIICCHSTGSQSMRNIVHSSGGVPIAAASRPPWMTAPGMLPAGTLASLPTPPASSLPSPLVAPAASAPSSTAARGAFPTAASVLGSLPSASRRASIPGLAGLTSKFDCCAAFPVSLEVLYSKRVWAWFTPPFALVVGVKDFPQMFRK